VAAIYFAETINKLAANNWKHFSRQHYFDPQGVFISVVFSGPLIIISLILLVSFKSYVLSYFVPIQLHGKESAKAAQSLCGDR
jgi:hypothetical protein